MKDIDPNKNCHEYCPYSRLCKYAKGSNGMDPDDCGTYYKIDDILAEARDIAREQRRELEEEEDDYE